VHIWANRGVTSSVLVNLTDVTLAGNLAKGACRATENKTEFPLRPFRSALHCLPYFPPLFANCCVGQVGGGLSLSIFGTCLDCVSNVSVMITRMNAIRNKSGSCSPS
jgi:hypothetical protein